MGKLTWVLAIIFAVIFVALSPVAGFEFVFFIDAIGFDMLVMLLEIQLFITFGLFLEKTKFILYRINRQLMRWDSYYFLPTAQNIKECPSLLIHAIPSVSMFPILSGMVAYKVIIGLP